MLGMNKTKESVILTRSLW